jgi:hypothetical protein
MGTLMVSTLVMNLVAAKVELKDFLSVALWA